MKSSADPVLPFLVGSEQEPLDGDQCEGLAARAERLVLSKIPSLLDRVEAELEEVGVSGFQASSHAAAVRDLLRASFADGSGKPGHAAPCLLLGVDGDGTTPLVAYSRVLWALEEHLKVVFKELVSLHNQTGERISAWLERRAGRSDLEIDYATLSAVLTIPEDLVRGLDVARQVLESDLDRLAQIVDQSKGNEGRDAFKHDLGAARLSDSALAEVLAGLWAVDDPAVIEAVISDPRIATSDHAKPIRFLAHLLQRRLALSDPRRADLDRQTGRTEPVRPGAADA